MSSEALTTEYLDEGSFDDWRRLLADSPQGGIYSTPEYLRVLCDAAGGTFRILAARRGTELVSGVALYERSLPFGKYVSGRYLLYYNGLVVRSYDSSYPSRRTSRHLEALGALERALSAERYLRVRLQNDWTLTDVRPFVERGWRAYPSYTYVADLSDTDALHSRMDTNFQRLIRRCQQSDLVFTQDDDFSALFRLHRLTHQRKGSPLYLDEAPFTRFFEGLRNSGLCRLDHLRTPDGKSVASQLTLLGPHSAAHTVCAGADPDYMNLGTTPYIRWRVFEDLARLGYSANDLTDAALNPVTRFKSQLGADLKLRLVVANKDHPLMAAMSAGRAGLARAARALPASSRERESDG